MRKLTLHQVRTAVKENLIVTVISAAFALLAISAPAVANPLPAGACCMPDGTCQWADGPMCQAMGGIYLGDLTSCDPNPCSPWGACCYPDGHCTFVPQQLCGSPAVWYGFSEGCDPNPCPPCKLPCGDGACCLLSGGCVIGPADYCGQLGGLWYPGLYTCTPDPCATSGLQEPNPSKIELQTWGKIKSTFR
jgi:hypothetical protein